MADDLIAKKAELLDRLMDIFFTNSKGEIIWGLEEDTPLHKEDPELAKELWDIYFKKDN